MTPSSITRTNTEVQLAGPTRISEIRIAEILDGQMYLFLEHRATDPDEGLSRALAWITREFSLRMTGGIETLPYTNSLERLFEAFSAEHGRVLPLLKVATRAESKLSAFWLTLLRLRKSGRLGTADRRHDAPLVEVSAREMRVVREKIGLPSSRRDRERLPYTGCFDELFDRFHRACSQGSPSTLNKNAFWRAIVRVMKATRVDRGPELFTEPLQ